MEPNKYQLDIIKWIETGEGNATCNAVAGSGKSTTLYLVAKQLAKNGLPLKDIKIIVFGKQNSYDLKAKFGEEWKSSIQTLHSLGFRLLQKEIGHFKRNEKINNGKYRRIAEDLYLIPKKYKKKTSRAKLIDDEIIDKVESFLKLIDLVRLTLVEPSCSSISDLVFHHNLEGINDCEAVAKYISEILLIGQEKAIDEHNIDFTDMIWLPVKWELNNKSWFPSYKFVLVDECQDLNAVQLNLSLMIVGSAGRSLYVGDPKQAIYGFAGADNESYQKIVRKTEAKELPLSLCYRCPKSHIELVNNIFPSIPIKSTDCAPEGVVVSIKEKNLWEEGNKEHLVIGDMVLCRKTAPLVVLCIRLIAKGIAATVRGKDIGKHIKSELNEIAKINNFTYNKFGDFLDLYKNFKFKAYSGRDNAEQLKENLADKLDALLTIYTSQPNATKISDLESYIDDLFSDEDSPITLATCHRAKGLEGDRIFILKPEDMPMNWEKQLEWQKEQEDNLLYVALTRSKSELYLIQSEEKEISWFPNKTSSETTTSKGDKSSFQKKIDTNLDSEAKSALAVNNLQSGSVLAIQRMIDDKLDFEQKCQLLTLLKKEINEEKRHRVVLSLKEDPSRSDRLIAQICFVSTPFVSKIRKELETNGEIEVVKSRLDRRGHVQKVN